MQADYAEAFEREQGCTEPEWLGWLPGAVGPHTWHQPAPGRAQVQIGPGRLHLAWTVMPPRVIALIRMPRMHITYRFEGLTADERRVFMKYFDLYMQRGGG